MTKKTLIFLFFVSILCFSGWTSVNAVQKSNIEKDYYDLGYKSVLDALKDAESYYKTDLNLPKELPPLKFTHSFGRFNREGNQNNGLEIEYLNEEKHFNYMINVHPAKNGIHFSSNYISKISLKDGSQAYYYTFGEGKKVLAVLKFQKEGQIYLLSIQESLLDKPLPTLVKIANSL